MIMTLYLMSTDYLLFCTICIAITMMMGTNSDLISDNIIKLLALRPQAVGHVLGEMFDGHGPLCYKIQGELYH
jgi:hypothetical protein